jgi:hypothetical protein
MVMKEVLYSLQASAGSLQKKNHATSNIQNLKEYHTLQHLQKLLNKPTFIFEK